MVKFHTNIGEDVLISGEFGESLLAYRLVKKNMHVIMARTAGFDLVVKDINGKTFSKKRNIAISVKTQTRNSWSKNLKKDYKKLKKISKIWGFKPYFAFITRHNIIVFPAELSKNKKIQTPTGNVSVSLLKKLEQAKNNQIIIYKYEIEDIKNRK
ncbi:MAG: hypothetical protein AABX00_06540 [Nanoarchaeota archaeon]